MEISFYPKTEKNKDGKVSLQMLIQHHGPAKLGIGLSIFPEFWDKNTHTVTKKHPSFKAVNDTIAQKRSIAEDIERQIRTANGFATVEEIAAEFKARTKPPRRVTKPKEVKEVVLDMETVYTRWMKENKGYVKNLRIYRQVVDSLNKFHPGILAEELDEKTVKKYFSFMAEKEYAVSTIYKHSCFIKIARSMAKLSVTDRFLKIKAINSEQPDLYIEELRAIITVKLDRLEEQIERDMFVLQVLLPLRDSHYRVLKPHHLKMWPLPNGEEVLVADMFQIKTDNPVILPLPPLALQIWEKYGGMLPLYAQQKRNEYLKRIALKAGLFRQFVDRQHKLNGFKEVVLPLWKKVSTYTSRHTAATLLFEQTGDESISGWILGHKNHGIAGVTGVYAKKKASKALPTILEAWKVILGDVELPG